MDINQLFGFVAALILGFASDVFADHDVLPQGGNRQQVRNVPTYETPVYGPAPTRGGQRQDAVPTASQPSSPSGYVDQQAMSPEKLKQLKGLLQERAQVVMGPGPAGANYEGYRGIAGTSLKKPCLPGYEPIVKNRVDKETGQNFFRCFKPGGQPSLVTEMQ